MTPTTSGLPVARKEQNRNLIAPSPCTTAAVNRGWNAKMASAAALAGPGPNLRRLARALPAAPIPARWSGCRVALGCEPKRNIRAVLEPWSAVALSVRKRSRAELRLAVCDILREGGVACAPPRSSCALRRKLRTNLRRAGGAQAIQQAHLMPKRGWKPAHPRAKTCAPLASPARARARDVPQCG